MSGPRRRRSPGPRRGPVGRAGGEPAGKAGGRPGAAAAVPGLAPPCRHFGRCGGCSQLDVPIAAQLQHKVADLEQLLAPFLRARSGRQLAVQFQPSPDVPLHYRTRLLYPVRPDRDGRPILGIYERRSHELVRITECRTQDAGLTALGQRAETILRELRLEPWDEVAERGFVRAFAARLAPGTGELLMGVVTRPGLFAQGAELAERLFAAARDLPHGARRTVPTGVVRSISDRAGNYLFGDRNVPLKGRDYHEDRADGLVFRLRFGAFYQVHRAASAVLYRPALQLCGDLRGQRVVDGYGGVGTFGLRCMKRGARAVEIVEDNAVSCGDAAHNAAANGFSAAVRVVRARFAEADFAPGCDLLIVDPPRKGLEPEGVARVVAAKPGRLLCVHCSAEALARDLEGLTAAGYAVEQVRLCDMFPHTEHVEVVTLLSPPR